MPHVPGIQIRRPRFTHARGTLIFLALLLGSAWPAAPGLAQERVARTADSLRFLLDALGCPATDAVPPRVVPVRRAFVARLLHPTGAGLTVAH